MGCEVCQAEPPWAVRGWEGATPRIVGGRRLVLRREPEGGEVAEAPDYQGLLEVARLDEADRWRWSWSEASGSLEPEG